MSTVINTLLLLPLPRSFLPPLLPYVLSNYPLLLPLLSTILVPVILAQTSKISLRSSIFQCLRRDYFLLAYCPNHCYPTPSIKWLYIVDSFSLHTSCSLPYY